MDIKVNTRVLNDKAQAVEVQGEIDVYTSPRVKETINELIEKGHYQLVINLEGVRYIDSTGLGVLIGALKKRPHFAGLHQPPDQEDFQHHGTGQDFRDLQR